ncbi:MAG: hypothetical protein EXQ52_04055 [Bryobacterales bacterium]|nr:hypothetical protein [Bryobacterales bacterium]
MASTRISHIRKLLNRPKIAIVLDFAIVFLAASALIAPLYRVKYLDKWSSIESTFIADGRFLAENWPHPQWQRLWYCGTRFDYVYPPALRYGTALLVKIYPGMIPARAYHIYIAFFYALGIAGVYLLVRIGGRERWPAWLAAAATALLSPSFLVLKEVRDDAWLLVPQRLGVLIRYGEGPHMTALAIIGFALTFSFRAIEKYRPIAMAGAALSCALVFSNNFYGATALVILFPVLCWSLWITHQEDWMWLRAAAIVVSAWGLTAFWLSPSYLKITLYNMQFVAQHGNRWSLWVAIALAVVYILVSDRRARGKPHLAYPVFVWGAFLFFSLNVVGNHFLSFRVIGEPQRLIPELDLTAIILAVEGVRRLWTNGASWMAPRFLFSKSWVPKTCAVLIVLASFSVSGQYVRRARDIYIREPDYRQRVEYQIQEWMVRNYPDTRAMAAGSIRLWYNAWNDLAQVGGGSDQGQLNPVTIMMQSEVLAGENPKLAVDWLVAFGAGAIIVSDKTSQEVYHDYPNPKKFSGVLPVLYDDGRGNVIYRVPRRFPALARVVDRRRFDELKPIRTGYDIENIGAYADAIEHGPDSPVSLKWDGTDAMDVQVTLGAGESLIVQESFDPEWRAVEGGRNLDVRPDVVGFMRIDAPPGEHRIRLYFPVPHWNRFGWAVTLLTAAGLIALIVRRPGRHEAPS